MSKLKSYSRLSDLYNARKRATHSSDKDVVESASLNKYGYSEINTENERLIVKRFGKDSYTGPTQQDFRIRLNAMYETAIQELKNKGLNATEFERYQKKLEVSRNQALANINAKCEIKPAKLEELRAREPETRRIIKQATLYIQQFVIDALTILSPDAFEDIKSLEKARDQFAAAESKLNAANGRANFLNYYPSLDDNVERVSIARVIGDAIPSTERLGNPPGKLPNFMECGIGYRDNRGIYHHQFSGYRHSSYPPIKIAEDDFSRQQNAAFIVKDMLSELAKKAIQKGHTVEPIPIELSSLTLLTPLALRDKSFTDKKWMPKGESEYMQLQESYNALMMYNQRETTIEIDGKPIIVKLSANLVNAPSNPLGVKSAKSGSILNKIAQSKLETNINAQGMNHYMDEVEAYLIKERFKLPFQLPNNSKREITLKNLNSQLINLNEQLEMALSLGNKVQYELIQHTIEEVQSKLFAIESEKWAERKALFDQNRTRIEKFLEQIEVILPRDKAVEIAELYYQSISMFMDGKVEPGHFGARYLLVNEKLGKSVDFYCKSGEDRTGRMQNLVEELCEFSRKEGRYPAYDFKNKNIEKNDLKTQQQIAKNVSMGSVSPDICESNAKGARGLQISDSLALNEGLPNRSGDDLGKTAKGVLSFRDAGLKTILIKKFKPLDKDRTQIIQQSLQNSSRGNILVESAERDGFESKVIRAKDRADYEKNKEIEWGSIPPQSRVVVSATKTSAPAYIAQFLNRGDMVVTTKKYEVDPGISPTKSIVACIEQDLYSSRDMTKVPKGKSLPIEDDEEIAFKQAFARLRPPFNAKEMTIVLRGADNKQVARLHAALLVLKESHPSLKDLKIDVQGYSKTPQFEKSASKQKIANQHFIEQQLSSHWVNTPMKEELSLLIEKQAHMKLIVHSTRNKESQDLNMVEGARISPFDKK